MLYYNSVKISNEAPLSNFAAELLCNELNDRLPGIAKIVNDINESDIIFKYNLLNKDEYKIDFSNQITIYAGGIRGSVYAVGLILRKIIKNNDGFCLIKNIGGTYTPCKQIRGHQLGYRTTPNSYDAWDYDQYFRYYLDLMFFGVNTVEHIPYQNGHSKRNELMKYDEEEFLIKATDMANDIDLNISLWHPNCNNETDESAAEIRGRLYSKLKRLDYLFIPGGDPGVLPADQFINRCKVISKELKKAHPEAEIWPSAQAPHEIKNWAEVFVGEMNELPEEIDGIIYGPNHALPLNELRDKIPEKYQFRFYPDITHNVRCEYPVHYYDDDWNYALCTCLSRECTNPRPMEYERLYRETEGYFIGSVSYSEGITDDVNKAVFSSLDFDINSSAEEAVQDYCRLFFFGADTEKLSGLIFGLEENWKGAPENNCSINEVFTSFNDLVSEYPFLNNNWRFLQLKLRSCCDEYVRRRVLFDNEHLQSAKELLISDKYSDAIKVLKEDYSIDIKEIRSEIEYLCEKLFNLIGLQTDVKRYHADSWERGAILETIDLPVSDKQWLLNKSDEAIDSKSLLEYFNRNDVNENEYYFSVALNGIPEKQEGEIYMNFRGDRPDFNNGDLPTALFNVFDNLSYHQTIDGLRDDCDYILHITYLDKRDNDVKLHTIKANGSVIYCGPQFGNNDIEYDNKFCKNGFVSAKYTIPKGIIKNGILKLEFYEPNFGIMFSEFSLRIKQ